MLINLGLVGLMLTRELRLRLLFLKQCRKLPHRFWESKFPLILGQLPQRPLGMFLRPSDTT